MSFIIEDLKGLREFFKRNGDQGDFNLNMYIRNRFDSDILNLQKSLSSEFGSQIEKTSLKTTLSGKKIIDDYGVEIDVQKELSGSLLTAVISNILVDYKYFDTIAYHYDIEEIGIIAPSDKKKPKPKKIFFNLDIRDVSIFLSYLKAKSLHDQDNFDSLKTIIEVLSKLNKDSKNYTLIEDSEGMVRISEVDTEEKFYFSISIQEIFEFSILPNHSPKEIGQALASAIKSFYHRNKPKKENFHYKAKDINEIVQFGKFNIDFLKVCLLFLSHTSSLKNSYRRFPSKKELKSFVSSFQISNELVENFQAIYFSDLISYLKKLDELFSNNFKFTVSSSGKFDVVFNKTRFEKIIEKLLYYPKKFLAFLTNLNKPIKNLLAFILLFLAAFSVYCIWDYTKSYSHELTDEQNTLLSEIYTNFIQDSESPPTPNGNKFIFTSEYFKSTPKLGYENKYQLLHKELKSTLDKNQKIVIDTGGVFWHYKKRKDQILSPNEIAKYSNSEIATIPETSCFFNKANDTYKILILNFPNRPNEIYNQSVGEEIRDRLNELSDKDSLNIVPCLISDFNFDLQQGEDMDSFMQRVMTKHNANHIIYGETYSSGVCDEDKICFNYITDYKPDLEDLYQFDGNETPIRFEFENLKKGELQTDIDILIYWNAYLESANTHDEKKQEKYINHLIDSLDYKNYGMFKQRGLFYYSKNLFGKAKLDFEKCSLNSSNADDIDYFLLKIDASQRPNIDVFIDMNEKYKHITYGTLLFKTEFYYNYGLYNIALENIDFLKSFNPKNNLTLRIEMLSLLKLDRSEEAEDLLIEGIKNNPKASDLRLYLGELYFLTNNLNKALGNFTQSIEIWETYQALLYRGQCLQALKKYDQALIDYNKALYLNKLNPNVYVSKALLFLKIGQSSNALIEINKAIDLDCKNRCSYYFYKYLIQGENESLKNTNYYSNLIFLTELRKLDLCHNVNVSWKKVYNNIGSNYILKGEYLKAEKYLLLSYNESNSYEQCLSNLTEFYFYQFKNYPLALKYAKELEKVTPNNSYYNTRLIEIKKKMTPIYKEQ